MSQKTKSPIKEQIAGNAWHDGEYTLEYLWPFDTEYEGNNDSLVLYMFKMEILCNVYGGLGKGRRTEELTFIISYAAPNWIY